MDSTVDIIAWWTMGQSKSGKTYEIVEKALFKCVQRQDESNDSFLARCDVVWSELKAKKIDLDQVHAYIVLRGSLLTSEDKKRVILESESSTQGALTIDKVSQSVRMLGTAFFNEMIGQKKSKGKIYDQQTFLTEDVQDEGHESHVYVADEIGEEDYYEQLLLDEDEDALLIADYESAAADTLQSDEDLASAYNAYSDARKRLSDRFKNRGFWPVSSGKGKSKIHGSKGKGKSYGRGPRKSLQQRIMESTCRHCGKRGHWRAECPERRNASANSAASTAVTMTAEAVSLEGEPDALPMEFIQLPVVQDYTIDDSSLHLINVSMAIPNELRERLKHKGSWDYDRGKNLKSHPPRNEASCHLPMRASDQPKIREPDFALFASHGTSGILDTGATKSVIGSKLLPSFLEGLPKEVRSQLSRTSCDITFRFGNQGTLDSSQALVIPLKSIGLGLKIAVVPGETPLLLSNTLLRTLKASINSECQVLSSPMFKHDVHLQLSARGLYLLDVNELLKAQKGPSDRTSLTVAETFTSHDFSECKSDESHQTHRTIAKSSESNSSIATCHDMKPEFQSHENDSPHTCNRAQKFCKAPEQSNQQNEIFQSHRESSRQQKHECTETSWPKSPHPTFLDLVKSTNPPSRNEFEQPFRSNHGQGVRRQPGSVSTADNSGDGRSQDHLWKSPHGANLYGNVVGGAKLGQVVHQDLLRQPKDRASKVPDVFREDDFSSRTRAPPATDGIHDAGSCPATRQGTTKSQGISLSGSLHVHGDQLQHRDRAVGCDGSRRSVGPQCEGTRRRSPPGEHRSPASQNDARGECFGGDLAARPTVQQLRDGRDRACLAGDIDNDFEESIFNTTSYNNRHQIFHQLVAQMTKEFHEVSKQVDSRSAKPIQVLEVFCSSASELTKQTNQLGYRACRYGYEQGDLSTKEGRAGLFNTVVQQRPNHIWYSPTCGPWSSWSQFNEMRSTESFVEVQRKREENLFQLALGLVLFRVQQNAGRHMHWEQPARSIMMRTPMLWEIIQNTQVAKFDMCRVGALRDPMNQLLYKKGMEIHTTSQEFYLHFNGLTCNKQHQHQPLEGETIVRGMRIKRTELSENYSRKFARKIAQVLTKVKCQRSKPMGISEAFATDAKRATSASLAPATKRAKLTPVSPLIEPSEMPAKKRRLHEKTTDNVGTLCIQLCEKISSLAPRVGRKEISDPTILAGLQEVFHDKQIVRVVICKGTERTITPPKNMMPAEAPFRRAIIIQRQTKAIKVEGQWEEWRHLSARQLWRRSHPSFLNITVFARNPLEISSPASESQRPSSHGASESSGAAQSPAPDVPASELSSAPALDSQLQPQSVETPESTKEPSQIDFESKDHGPKFMITSPENKKLAIRLHKNLGHPDPTKLSKVLQQRGYSEELVRGVLDLKCSICQMQQQPKLQRPATLKEELNFGDKISMDGVKWSKKQGQDFHFYHFICHGTNYHTAVVAPNRSEVQERFTSGWLNWAGPPNSVIMDSASEFVSQAFEEYLQSLNVQCTVVPPDAHWQMGRIERHGGVLQSMLSKYELEHDVTDYFQFQQALTHCTMAKNACSLRHGYSPETLVFGRGLRVPGSIVGDDTLPAHAIATNDDSQGIRFRKVLAMRETARRAFHAADNDMAIRRAALRRDRPHRGAYEPGEWVMVWKSHLNKGSWIGPAKVIIQDGPTSVFCNNAGSVMRAAPEHIRPVSAVEARLIPMTENPMSLLRTSTVPPHAQVPSNTSNQIPTESPAIEVFVPPENARPASSGASEQPDQEPDENSQGNLTIKHDNISSENSPNNSDPRDPQLNNPEAESQSQLEPHEIPLPDATDDELLCDLLTCTDSDDSESFAPDGKDHVWKAELEFTQAQLDEMCVFQENPCEEDFLMLATASKKQRTEVKLSTLDPHERQEFEAAKAKEVNNWLQTGTVERMFRNALSPEQILRCRWIYVWKPIECPKEQKENGGRSRKAKARLVVLGYLDPQLETIPRDSPTPGRTSKMLIAQVIASMRWTLMSFDIKAAFLQGRTQEGREIAIEPVPEMVKAMDLKPTEVCKLIKSAYGLIDAPFLWFTELDTTLRSLNFIPSPFDPCLYLLFKPGAKEPSGILGVHVDDGLCGGDSYFQSQVKALEAKFPFGSRKSQSFVFTGIEMSQQSDSSIVMSQEKDVSKIEPIHIKPERKSQLELPVTERERQDLRALIGSLQYAAVNTRPDLSSRLSFIQNDINQATIATLIQGNQILHEAKRHKDTSICIQPIPMDKIRFLAFSDASFASKKQPESHTGTIIMTTHEDIGKNHVCPVNPISWGCKKIQRVVTSTLAAETTSLSTTLDQLSWLRLFWSWVRNPCTDWKNPSKTLKELPSTFTTATFKEDPSIAVTDCKSLFDLITRTAPLQCQEFRTQLQARAIKDMIAEGVKVRWVHSAAQLADALTKIMQTHFLRHTLKVGQYSLHDEGQVLKERATSRSRMKWLQTCNDENLENNEEKHLLGV